MATLKRFIFITHFNLLKKWSINEFFYKIMVFFISFIWGFISSYLFYLVKFIIRFLFRFHDNKNILKENQSNEPNPNSEPEIVSESESEVVNLMDREDDQFEENDAPKFIFKFQYQNSEETLRNNGESEESVSSLNTNTSKYQFLPVKGFSGFMEEPEVMNFTVNQLHFDENKDAIDNKEKILHGGSLSVKNFSQSKSETEPIVNEIQISQTEQLVDLESNSVISQEEISDESEVLSVLSEKEEVIGFDSDSESISVDDNKLSFMNHIIDTNGEEFLSENDFRDRIKLEPIVEQDEDIDENFEVSDSEENPRVMETELNENFESYEEEEEIDLQNSSVLGADFLTENELEQQLEECSEEMEDYPLNYEDKSQELNSKHSSMSEFEDSDDMESMLEHEDLIEQLKMEIKKIRVTRLPTILEESESPKIVEDLKPWKIDEKYFHKDRIDQLQKFYKIYKEKMRKFDIVNYQKMYTIGFLQLKDPLHKTSSRKSGTQTFTSIISQNFRFSKPKRPEMESTAKFIKELEHDLEVVYVGQLCLSWEFIHWQYLKARELLDSDPYETRRYNEVAGEFQQFQVLIQRFLENEPFGEGPRVQNYIRSRCILRNLLQVPVIKEDSKDKDGRRKKDAITCTMLLQIIDESMKVYWEFLRAEKNEGNMILKSLLGPQVELQNPEDSKLLVDVQTTLQKKEKKLKELLKIGNCIVRKFQKENKERSNQVLFFSQVDIKLVSRVLNMPKLTSDQLVWCLKKLNKITLVDRNIHMEPSFLPFPC